MSNADIARQLTSLAQLLSAEGENPFKVKAYRRAAETVGSLSAGLVDQVRAGADLTAYPGIGPGISSAIREIVERGTLDRLETLRVRVDPTVAALSEYPRLNPRRVLRMCRQLNVRSIAGLKSRLARGEVARKLGLWADRYLRQGFAEAGEMLLYDADPIAAAVEEFLRHECGIRHVTVAGDFRRRVEVVAEIGFVIETGDFPRVVSQLEHYGGGTERIEVAADRAVFRHASGILLRIENAAAAGRGLSLLHATGSEAHLALLEKPHRRLARVARSRQELPSEAAVYRELGLDFIEPELREGRDEVARAARGQLPVLVSIGDIRGELHAHSTSSDGSHSIAQLAAAARARGYAYIGITDHSQSLKIAGGVTAADLRRQIRAIDRLNAKLDGIRVLKSAEVDILPDGSLDYPDALLRELDYTLCSIHSRFSLGRREQTERLLRAMDHPCFTILGHATGRLLLRRPGYEIDFERVLEHARQRHRYFEINASPDRLDLSADHARQARAAGVKIAVCTDAHSIRELDFIRGGIDQARRAGLEKGDILNCLEWRQLERLFRR